MFKHCISLFLLFLGGNVFIAAQTYGRESLRDIQGVSIQIVANDLVEETNLEVEELQIIVELELRKAGIRVLTEDERLDVSGQPFLSVNIAGAGFRLSQDRSTLGHAFWMQLRLFQNTKLLKDLARLNNSLDNSGEDYRKFYYRGSVESLSTVSSGTWHTASVFGVVPLSDMYKDAVQDTMRDSLVNLTKLFISDYLSENSEQVN